MLQQRSVSKKYMFCLSFHRKLGDHERRRTEATMKKFKVLVILLGVTVFTIFYLSFRGIEDNEIKAENVLMLNNKDQNFLKQLKIAKQKPRPLDNSAPRVLLLSQFRTGSTMLGEIFNKNPDMFYLWEPVTCMPHNKTSMTADGQNFVKYIRELCNCEVSKLVASCLGNEREVLHSSGVATICRRVTGVYGAPCPLASPSVFRTQCAKSSGNIAIKITQVDLSEIKPIVESDLNVKIIHRVRDPRGTANSRHFFMMTPDEKQNYKKSIKKGQDYAGVKSLEELGFFDGTSTIPFELRIEQLCEWTKVNLQTSLSGAKWLRDRYMILRFEDFIRDPVNTSRNIYSFIGKSMPFSVLQWLSNLQITTSSEEASQLLNEESLFFPRKKLADIVTSWRTYTKFSDIEKIQSICGDVMSMLGYELVNTEDALRDLEFKVMTDELPSDFHVHLNNKFNEFK